MGKFVRDLEGFASHTSFETRQALGAASVGMRSTTVGHATEIGMVGVEEQVALFVMQLSKAGEPLRKEATEAGKRFDKNNPVETDATKEWERLSRRDLTVIREVTVKARELGIIRKFHEITDKAANTQG